MCRLAGVARSTYYAWRQHRQQPRVNPPLSRAGRPRRGYWFTDTGTKVPEGQVVEWLSTYIATPDGQSYGHRKLTTWLRREHHLVINKKSVYRLLAEADLLQGRRFPIAADRPVRRLAANHTITGPNQLWELDLKYGYIAGQDRFFYLCSVIDVFDRSILGYHIGWTCTAQQALRALQAAVVARRADWTPGTTPVVRTDNGPQFVAHAWADGVAALDLVHERIPNATPNKNAHIESWHSVLEADCLGNQVFRTLAEAYNAVAQWITFYNERRMHESLDDWPPAVFYRWVLAGTAPTIKAVHC